MTSVIAPIFSHRTHGVKAMNEVRRMRRRVVRSELFYVCNQRPNLRRGGVLPLPAVQYRKFDRTNAKWYAPVGADDPVRPARCVRKHGCTDANPHSVCRGRCRALPACRTIVFTIRRDKFVTAPRADRGVRPYRTVLVFADGACNFVIASGTGGAGPRPYANYSLFIIHHSSFI